MSPKTPNQNKEIREQSRKQIQQAAFELFAKKGFANTSISAIAKKANVSKGLIYHYFDSKETILEAIFQYWVEVTEKSLDFPNDLSAAQKMEYLINELFTSLREEPETNRLMTVLALQPDAITAVKEYVTKATVELIEVAATLLKELNYGNPQEEAYYLGAKLDGITLGFLTLGDDYPFEAMKQKLLEEYIPDEND